MILSHFWGLIFHPAQEWNSIREKPLSILRLYLGQVMWLAAIPAVCTYVGTTQTGWSLPGNSQVVKLTADSATVMAGLTWLAMLSSIAVIGGFVQWMAETFGSKPTLAQSVAFTSYCAVPMFIAGICGLYPSIWLAIVAGTVAVSISTWLLYSGLPTFMQIPEERAFIYSSSILCIAMVVFVTLMITTVIFWGMGAGPEFVQVY